MFVELGSDASCWTNRAAAEACVLAALEAARAKRVEDVFVEVGGGHYAPAFTGFVLNSANTSVSHTMPRYVLRQGEAEISMAMERSLERPKGVLLDWNGIDKEDRDRLSKLLDGLKVLYRKL